MLYFGAHSAEKGYSLYPEFKQPRHGPFVPAPPRVLLFFGKMKSPGALQTIRGQVNRGADITPRNILIPHPALFATLCNFRGGGNDDNVGGKQWKGFIFLKKKVKEDIVNLKGNLCRA